MTFTVTIDPEQRIAAEIAQLWSRCGRASLDFDLATGKAIVEGLHSGRVNAWRRRRKSHPSLRKISKLLGGLRRPPQLYYAACAYVLAQKHPSVLRLEHLKPGHLHAVAGLSEDLAFELLARAHRAKQTVSALREAAALLREPGKGGRPAIREELRQLWKGSRLELPAKDVDLASLLQSVTLEDRSRMAEGLRRVGTRCMELAAEVGAGTAEGEVVESKDEPLPGREPCRRCFG